MTTTTHPGPQAGARPVPGRCCSAARTAAPRRCCSASRSRSRSPLPRPARSTPTATPSAGSITPPPRQSNPAPSARPMHLLRLEHPAPNFPDHLTPAGQ